MTTQLSGRLCGRVGNWDDHAVNHHVFDALAYRAEAYDQAVSALIEDIYERGLDKRVLVVVTGEFGRTPKLNNRSTPGGRDHYPRCMFMLMAGGGVRGGQVLGESDDKASMPKHEAFSPDDVAATFYHTLGIDHTKEYHTNTGRPITIVRDGKVLHQLLG